MLALHNKPKADGWIVIVYILSHVYDIGLRCANTLRCDAASPCDVASACGIRLSRSVPPVWISFLIVFGLYSGIFSSVRSFIRTIKGQSCKQG